MKKIGSRLAHFEEKRAYRRLFLTITGSLILFLALIFLGLPFLVKVSLFVDRLRGGNETSQIKDTIPPFPPSLEAPYTATNSAEIAISGYAEPNSNLELFLNNTSFKKVLLGADGNFSFLNIPLKEGENKITAQTKDTADNVSQPSEPLVIIYKKTPPPLEINQPQDGQTIGGDKREVAIVGLTEIGTKLTINGRLVMIRNDGTFSYGLPLNNGENLIKIVATDIAGNQTIVERKVVFTP